MSCQHCCGANRLFDLKKAKKELRKFRKKGPSGPTALLIKALASFDLQGKSLLDIGGGIGAIQWAFIERGGGWTTDVDASQGYLDTAKEYAFEKKWEGKTSFYFGDFNEVIGQIGVHSFVTLDKVVCCYPDYQQLLGNAMGKTGEVLALSFPLGGWISKTYFAFLSLFLWFMKNPFRPYIHAPASIHQYVVQHQFELCEKSIVFPWHVRIYRRVGKGQKPGVEPLR